MSLDTLSIARELRAADVAPAQAEAIASAIGRAVNEGSATKADLVELRSAAKGDLKELQSEMQTEFREFKADVKGEFRELRAEFDARFERIDSRFVQMESSVDAKLERIKNEMIRWFITSLVTLAAVIIAAIKLV